MSKRRKLPAPPLVLEPYLVRLLDDGRILDRMLEFGDFLRRHSLLTDGGVKNLELRWEGRNGFRTISSQDVRGWAHALVLEMWPLPREGWESARQDYFSRFDKGKPRRPNHLQRLYLEWSRDRCWSGLLKAAAHHSFLWSELSLAVERLKPDYPERALLQIALRSLDGGDAWESAWQEGSLESVELLALLPFLPWPVEKRLELLQEIAQPSLPPALHYPLLSACRVEMEAALSLPSFPGLEEFANRLLPCQREQHQAEFFCGFRAFARSREMVTELFQGLSNEDPLLRVRYGARPGKRWLDGMREELEHLIELRSCSSSR